MGMESSLIFAICYLQETSSETSLCNKFENMDLLLPEQSIYSLDNEVALKTLVHQKVHR